MTFAVFVAISVLSVNSGNYRRRNWMSLSKTLDEEMPIERVVAKCGKCSLEIFDSKKSQEDSPHIVGNVIEMKYQKHQNETTHNNLDVAIDKPTTMKREIDCTVTVNG